MGSALPKQFALLGGVPVLVRTIGAFAEALPGATIVVVLPAQYRAFWSDLAARFDPAPHIVAEGGAERFHSVAAGLAALPDDVELVAVHDAVRPLVDGALIRRTAEAALRCGGAIPVLAPVDSLREVTAGGSRAVDRSLMRIVQTPQIFRAAPLRRAYGVPYDSRFTDDASVFEHAGGELALVEGLRENIKITTPDDLVVAEAFIAAREALSEDGARGL